MEGRLREEVMICKQQYSFMTRKSSMDTMFASRLLMEKYREGQKELHFVSVALKKACYTGRRVEWKRGSTDQTFWKQS